MIIYAPEPGPMIAGFLLPNVNTQAGQSRYVATESGAETACDTTGKSNGWTRIKRRAAHGAGTPRTALTRPVPLGLLSHKRREGQAVQKPRSSLYAMRGGRAVINSGQPVVKPTVTPAVAR